MPSPKEDLSNAFMSKATHINYVLIAGLGILLVTALVKLARKQEIEVYKVSLRLEHVPLVMLAFTAAHLYVGYAFNFSVRELIAGPDVAYSRDIFRDLHNKGPLFFEGIVSRLKLVQGPLGPMFIMDSNDPTTWLEHAAAVGAFVVMIKWTAASIALRIWRIILSAVIVVANWLIGGGWAVHCSCLSDPEFCRKLFAI